MKKNLNVVLLTLLIIGGICFIFVGNKLENNENIETIENDDGKNKFNDKDKENNDMKIIIDNKEYNVGLENNETAISLIALLPLELDMKDLNGNEKYYYLDETLPSNPKNLGKIEKGDIMLYGDDCLVVFYKSFNTNYSYTKIGHISNLPDLGNSNIEVKFIK